jgi:FkbM family methyltransferase
MHALIASRLSGGGAGVDIGANRGLILEFMSAASPGRHLAFEPLPALAQQLQDRFPGVDVRAMALSDQPGADVEFDYYADEPAFSGFPDRRSAPSKLAVQKISVPVSTLDAEIGAMEPRVIKIDVEGAEQEVMAGAIATIRKHRPMVVFEHGRENIASTGPIHDLLDSAGLSVFDIDGGGPFTREGLIARVQQGDIWNFFAC